MPEIIERLAAALADRYTIVRELGSGGMATVYLARDLKHERDVAIKVLRPELAAVIGADRFLQEIKVTANLQHPNILPLYDSGRVRADAEGRPGEFLFYVMPFIDGESLREKADREKHLKVDEAVAITRDVAAALDFAHRRGVIHRDIKPANVMLHDGRAVVADFGIALAVSHAGGSRLTETGLSIGTPQYMSPEQAMGDRELDARSDIYSLACTLYELLAGDPPHVASTAQAVVAKVITERAAPVSAHRERVPPHMTAAIDKALARLPADRFDTAVAFADALVTPGSVPLLPTRGRRSALTVALVALLVGTGVFAVWGWLRPAAPPVVRRLRIAMGSLQPLLSAPGPTVVLSRAGAMTAFVAQRNGVGALFVSDMRTLEVRDLPGTEGGFAPFFSPDGRTVGFLSGGRVMTIPLSGGTASVLNDSALLGGASWSDDGWIYFTHARNGGIARVSATGGPVTSVTTPVDSLAETDHRWVETLPEGRGLLFTAWRSSGHGPEIGVVDLHSGATRMLMKGSYARYASGGYLLVARTDGVLSAIPFSLAHLELTGSEIPITDRVLVKVFGSAELSVADDGTLLYQSGSFGSTTLVRVRRDGREQRLTPETRSYADPRISPDGLHVVTVVTSGSENADVWTFDVRDGALSRLTFGGYNRYPVWLPDGRRIAFSGNADGDRDIYLIPADGSTPAATVLARPGNQWESVWLPDGETFVYREGGTEGPSPDIRWARAGGSVDSAFLATERQERALALSPDGKWLAYVSDESGRDEVYVRAFPGPGGRRQVSIDGGIEPAWGNSGRELFYRSGEHLVTAALRVTAGLPDVVARDSLFSLTNYNLASSTQRPSYDVFPDDQSFVFVKRADTENPMVVLVLNWIEEMKRKN